MEQQKHSGGERRGAEEHDDGSDPARMFANAVVTAQRSTFSHDRLSMGTCSAVRLRPC